MKVRDEMWGGVWVGRADDVSGVLFVIGSLPSPHVSDGNGTEGGVPGTEVSFYPLLTSAASEGIVRLLAHRSFPQ